MSLGDLLRELRAQGVFLSARQVHYAIQRGFVPRPPLNGALAFVFTKRHVSAFKRHGSK